MFLEEDEELRIVVKKGGMKIPSLLDLYNTDKRPGKSFFEKCITLMYHKNKRVHEFQNLGPQERLQKIRMIFFSDYDINKILNNPKYIAAEEDYILLEYTPTQRLYEGIKKSIEHWKLYMSNIPMQKEIMYNGNHEVVVETDEGTKKLNLPIKAKILIDNSDEYIKALKNAEDMLEREEKMRKRMLTEELKQRVSSGDSMLQAGDFNGMLQKKRSL